jgi:hypothetical protein
MPRRAPQSSSGERFGVTAPSSGHAKPEHRRSKANFRSIDLVRNFLKSLVSVAVKPHPWAQSSDQTTISAGTGCLARAKWRRDTQIGAEFVTTAE